MRYCTEYSPTVIAEGAASGGYSSSANCFLAGLPVELRIVLVSETGQFAYDPYAVVLAQSAPAQQQSLEQRWGKKQPTLAAQVVPYPGDTLHLEWTFDYPEAMIKEFKVFIDTERGILCPDPLLEPG